MTTWRADAPPIDPDPRSRHAPVTPPDRLAPSVTRSRSYPQGTVTMPSQRPRQEETYQPDRSALSPNGVRHRPWTRHHDRGGLGVPRRGSGRIGPGRQRSRRGAGRDRIHWSGGGLVPCCLRPGRRRDRVPIGFGRPGRTECAWLDQRPRCTSRGSARVAGIARWGGRSRGARGDADRDHPGRRAAGHADARTDRRRDATSDCCADATSDCCADSTSDRDADSAPDGGANAGSDAATHTAADPAADPDANPVPHPAPAAATDLRALSP
jgi:hypothetical protein